MSAGHDCEFCRALPSTTIQPSGPRAMLAREALARLRLAQNIRPHIDALRAAFEALANCDPDAQAFGGAQVERDAIIRAARALVEAAS